MSEAAKIIFDTRRLGGLDGEKAAGLVRLAAQSGVTRFAVSPHYMKGASERAFIRAVKELPGKISISYKFGRVPGAADTEEHFTREFEAALTRFSSDAFDMYTLYDINSFEHWNEYKNEGEVYRAAVRLKRQGKIGRLSIVSCLGAEELSSVLTERPEIDCVIMPMSPLDMDRRADVMSLCARLGKTLYALTPLMGGLFETYPALVAPIRTEGLTPSQAALRYVCGAGIPVICDFSGEEEFLEAMRAVSKDAPEVTKTGVFGEYETFCTGCGLCLMCPIKSSAPTLMAAYNAYIVSGDPDDMVEYARRAFGQSEYLYNTRKCIGCRLCERVCPRGIKISERIERLKTEAHKT